MEKIKHKINMLFLFNALLQWNMNGSRMFHHHPWRIILVNNAFISFVICWLICSGPPQLYKLNIHNVVSEFVPLIMNTIMLQVSPQARYVRVCFCVCAYVMYTNMSGVCPQSFPWLLLNLNFYTVVCVYLVYLSVLLWVVPLASISARFDFSTCAVCHCFWEA